MMGPDSKGPDSKIGFELIRVIGTSFREWPVFPAEKQNDRDLFSPHHSSGKDGEYGCTIHCLFPALSAGSQQQWLTRPIGSEMGPSCDGTLWPVDSALALFSLKSDSSGSVGRDRSIFTPFAG